MKLLSHRFPFCFCLNRPRVAITVTGTYHKAELPQDRQTKIPAMNLAYS